MLRLTIVFLLCAIVSVVISTSPIPPCHPKCSNPCPGGYTKDSRGCTTACECIETPKVQCGIPNCPRHCRLVNSKLPPFCPTCECTDTPKVQCGIPNCPRHCRLVNSKTPPFCPTCECTTSRRVECPQIQCPIPCPSGFRKDPNGCPSCECAKRRCPPKIKACPSLD